MPRTTSARRGRAAGKLQLAPDLDATSAESADIDGISSGFVT